MSLMGDTMAHAVLPGAAIGFALAGFSLPAMGAGGLGARAAGGAAGRLGGAGDHTSARTPASPPSA